MEISADPDELQAALRKHGLAVEDEKRRLASESRAAPGAIPPDAVYQAWILYRRGKARGRLEGTSDGWVFTRFQLLRTRGPVRGPDAEASVREVVSFVVDSLS